MGFARAAYGRGRGRAGERRARPGDRAGGGLAGARGGGRAARRRQPPRRLRRAPRHSARQRRDRESAHGARCDRSGGRRRGARGARRHARQGTPRRQCDRRRLDGQPARGGGGARAAALRLSPRRGGGDAAAPRDPDLRRRRARGPARRHPGFHGDGDRRRLLRSGARVDGRGLSRRRADHARVGHVARGDGRRRLVARLRLERGGARCAGECDRARGPRSRRGDGDLARRGGIRVLRGRPLPSGTRRSGARYRTR